MAEWSVYGRGIKGIRISPLGDNCILVLVRGRAGAKQLEGGGAGVPDLVFFAGRDGNGIADANGVLFALDAHAALAFGDEIDFFGFDVVVLLRGVANGNARFCEALLADTGIAVRKEFADFGAILRDEGGDVLEVLDIHQGECSGSGLLRRVRIGGNRMSQLQADGEGIAQNAGLVLAFEGG